MKKYNSDNERIKRKYFVFLKEAKRQNEASVDAAAKAISRFENYTQWRDFKAFHFEQAVAFKVHLSKQCNLHTGDRLSKATLNSTLRSLKAFFQWLSMQTGYKSRINYSETEYFNLSEKDVRVATATRTRPVPTIEQIQRILSGMPVGTVIERRNRALVAFTLLTGARVSAIASLKLKHADLDKGSIFQDAREVNTKASKTITTYFFPVGDDVREIFEQWVIELYSSLLFSLDDPLFPKTAMGVGEDRTFQPVGLLKQHWCDAAPIRKLFKDASDNVGLPYFHPHSFRKTLGRLGQKLCKTPEQFKAWSQNLGHEQVLTTFLSYGQVEVSRQAEIFKVFNDGTEMDNTERFDDFIELIAQKVKSAG